VRQTCNGKGTTKETTREAINITQAKARQTHNGKGTTKETKREAINVTLNDTRQAHTRFTRSWSASDWVRVLRNITPGVIFARTRMLRLGA